MPQFSPLTIGGVTGAVALTENTTTANVGQSILIAASASGTVTLALLDGSTIVVTPQVGDNIYPFRVTKATVGTATITHYYNLMPSQT